MYGFEYDAETGGLLLNNSLALLSCEPRPVYAMELDVLGIDSFWKYEKQNTVPYMWAEAHKYYYRGTHIFSTAGGSLYQKPGIEIIMQKDKNGKAMATQVLPQGTELKPVDISSMCAKNASNINIIEQITLKKIYAVYKKYKDKLDCFHVAFSGGKDSVVLLELVKKALPHNSFIVIFGDTKMEFPDTYNVVDIVEKQCRQDGISFYRAASHLDPQESWRLFGPPSRVLRWCCTVHKAAPQTLKLREILGKNDYVGMDFVGVRASESLARSMYEEENYGKKQKGQYSHNSILAWTSAEIWLYIYSHNLPINETYKKGNSRAGCLFCPMGGGKGDFFQRSAYNKQIEEYVNIINEMNGRDKGNDKALQSYICNGGWNARKNGRDLTENEIKYKEEIQNGTLKITVLNPNTPWQEWIKTLGILQFHFEVKNIQGGYEVYVNEKDLSKNISLQKKFKQVFKKAAYCVKCRVCETNCTQGRISFENGLKIENCLHCGRCHELDSGCLVYNSLKKQTGENKNMKSINSFANHAPKPEWIKDLILKGNEFWNDNALGPNQVPMFRKFLRECYFINKKNELTDLFKILKKNGYESSLAWGFALSSLAYNAQVSWYIENMQINTPCTREFIAGKLSEAGVSKGDTTSVINAFKRFCELPIGTSLKFGNVISKGIKIVSLTRTKMQNIEPEVLLYSLYRYAEACDGYYQFTLSTLMDMQIKSAGISPVKLFGFDRDEMETMLRGLSAKYPDYIDVSFTHDLEKINLRDYHKSADILQLL